MGRRDLLIGNHGFRESTFILAFDDPVHHTVDALVAVFLYLEVLPM